MEISGGDLSAKLGPWLQQKGYKVAYNDWVYLNTQAGSQGQEWLANYATAWKKAFNGKSSVFNPGSGAPPEYALNLGAGMVFDLYKVQEEGQVADPSVLLSYIIQRKGSSYSAKGQENDDAKQYERLMKEDREYASYLCYWWIKNDFNFAKTMAMLRDYFNTEPRPTVAYVDPAYDNLWTHNAYKNHDLSFTVNYHTGQLTPIKSGGGGGGGKHHKLGPVTPIEGSAVFLLVVVLLGALVYYETK